MQGIPLIATRFCVAWSVCHLSYSYPLLKPFNGFTCNLAGTTLVGCNDTLCQMGSLAPRGLDIWRSNPTAKTSKCKKTIPLIAELLRYIQVVIFAGLRVEGPSQAKLEPKKNADGSLDVAYYPTEPGEYAVHVLCNAEDIPKSPYMADIKPAPAAAFDPSKVLDAVFYRVFSTLNRKETGGIA